MKRVRTVVLKTIATLALLEVVLQLIALGSWAWRARPRDDGPIGARVILCVGDSFTYGAGATSFAAAYPASLERRVQANFGPGWRVVNRGLAGQNSRDVLEHLDDDLARHRPELVCVILGCNDQWARPAELRVADADRSATNGFRWELRTLRLARLLRSFGAFRGDADAARDDPLVGRWTLGGTGIAAAFRADGTCVVGTNLYSWHREADRLVLSGPGLEGAFAVERRGDGFILRSDTAAPLLLVPSPAGAPEPELPPQRRAAWAVHAGQWELAESLWAQSLAKAAAGSDEELDGLLGQLRVYVETDRQDLARQNLQRIRAVHAARDDAWSTEVLLGALQALHDTESALALVRSAVERFPQNGNLWMAFASLSYWSLDRAAGLAAIERALEHIQVDRGDEANLRRMRAALLARENPRALAAELVQAWQQHRSSDVLRAELRRVGDAIDGDLLARACDDVGIAPADRAVVLAAHGADERTDYLSVLERHLVRIVERCRRAGAEPILAGYPFERSELERLARGVASAHRVAYVPVADAFRRAAQQQPGRQLLVADGHCNDAGYDLMAEIVYPAVRDAIAAAGRARR